MNRRCALAILVAVLLAPPSIAGAGGMVGANKFDLLKQYLGLASQGQGDAAEIRVMRAMARKAILDAEAAGFGFLRVSISGFLPVAPGGHARDLLPLWLADPAAFWAGLDAMLGDLDRASVRLVPTLMWTEVQFPALVGETTSDLIRTPHSRSRALLDRFVTEFVGRTRGRRTILFDELSNELNLKADLSLRARCRAANAAAPGVCAAVGDFSSAELAHFAHDMAAVVHGADPSRALSSGYSLPRLDAAHLARQPEWSARGPDWRADSAAEFAASLLETQRDFEMVSIHVYPGEGRLGTSPADTIRRAGQVAHGAGKKLFVGEFGDTGASGFDGEVLGAVAEGAADFAALWAWEFYQSSTYATLDTPPTAYSVEPGLHDQVLGLLPRLTTTGPTARAVPLVVLTWPLPCAAVNAPVMLAATASDGIRAPLLVVFTVDGKQVGEAASPPFRASFDPRGLPTGLSVIEARARGHDGAWASDRALVRVNGAGAGCVVGEVP
jgi:hypothetical protein